MLDFEGLLRLLGTMKLTACHRSIELPQEISTAQMLQHNTNSG